VVADPFARVVVLQVEDNGPGIPAHERELVFQAFYRSPDNTIEGSGLGLAIVREVAQQHDAEIAVDEAQPRAAPAAPGFGPGTLITVRFPAPAALRRAAAS
jgi:two-component system sensor histidine kinase TctE